MKNPSYWIGVASKDHVEYGVAKGIAQFCHGKLAPAQRIQKGDWVIYYSPKTHMKGGMPYQCFTAIGQVVNEEAYQVEMAPGFRPFRRNVAYLHVEPAPIKDLMQDLDFITDKTHWGAPFRYGFLSISEKDFLHIARALMHVRELTLTPDHMQLVTQL